MIKLEDLKRILLEEIEEFRDLGHRFVNKEVTVAEFKSVSGGMGAYAQRGGDKFMIRIKFPSGIVEHSNLRLIYDYTQKYNIDKIHLTTREAIQLHDLGIDDICDIMADCVDKNIFTRGGGGNYPRNVSLSPLAGVSKDEPFDPTPYAVLVNEYFLERITSYHLPRKLKVGFSNSISDTVFTTATDLGFMAVEKDNKPYFRLFIAGGIGPNPKLGVEYYNLVKPKDVLYYVEAMVRLFKQEGDYTNRVKARSRYILDRLGENEFINKYDIFLSEVIRNERFTELRDPRINTDYEKGYVEYTGPLIEQRQDGHYTVILHPEGGQLSTKDLKDLIDYIDTCSEVSLRLAMNESLYIRNLTKAKADELLAMSEDYRKDTLVEKSVACIGFPICQMGFGNSQETLRDILSYLRENNADMKLLPALQFSGCVNSCGRHQIATLGFVGKKKKVNDKMEDAFEVFAGGKVGYDITKFGTSYGIIQRDDLKNFILDLANELKKYEIDFETFYNNSEEAFKSLVEKYL